eukprot:GEMP01099596.1.p1 GENE.GEMP01099596.1~~GEMP01099596.1.p1  ORF type:complete len:143 (-),score=13.26 GEMP01099596.1:133-561(-)
MQTYSKILPLNKCHSKKKPEFHTDYIQAVYPIFCRPRKREGAPKAPELAKNVKHLTTSAGQELGSTGLMDSICSVAQKEEIGHATHQCTRGRKDTPTRTALDVLGHLVCFHGTGRYISISVMEGQHHLSKSSQITTPRIYCS